MCSYFLLTCSYHCTLTAQKKSQLCYRLLSLRRLLYKSETGSKTGNKFKNLERFVVSPHCLPGIFTETMQNRSNSLARVLNSYKNSYQSVEEPNVVFSDTFHKLWSNICPAAPRSETSRKKKLVFTPKAFKKKSIFNIHMYIYNFVSIYI